MRARYTEQKLRSMLHKRKVVRVMPLQSSSHLVKLNRRALSQTNLIIDAIKFPLPFLRKEQVRVFFKYFRECFQIFFKYFRDITNHQNARKKY